MPASAFKDAPPALGPGRWVDDGAASKLDRLPRLSDGLIDVARALTENLNGLLASPAEVQFNGLETSKIARVLERRGGKPVFAIVQASGWNTPIALQFDCAFVAVAVHALFGGDAEEFDPPERSVLTSLEFRIAGLMAEQIVDALTKGFAEVLPSPFLLEPIKPKPDPTLLGKPNVPVLIATLVVHTIGLPVEFDIVIPRAAIEPFGDRLAYAPDVAANVDPRWSEKLEVEISRARMALQARLDLPSMRLSEVTAFQPGQILQFQPGAGNEVRLSCAGTDLFRCELGQSAGCYSLKIAEQLAPADPSSHKDR